MHYTAVTRALTVASRLMPRQFNILALGPATRIGQAIIKRINDHFQFLNIAVPTGLYKEEAILPPYQIALDLANIEHLVDDFALTEVIIICSAHYSTETVRAAAARAKTRLIDAPFSTRRRSLRTPATGYLCVRG